MMNPFLFYTNPFINTPSVPPLITYTTNNNIIPHHNSVATLPHINNNGVSSHTQESSGSSNESQNIIHRYNICDKSTTLMRLNLDESIEDACKRIFKVNEVYENKAYLKNILSIFGNEWGFRPVDASTIYFKCSRSGKQRIRIDREYKQQRNRESDKCGCEWFIRYKVVCKTNKYIKITGARYEHTNGCIPCPDQLVKAKTLAGDYSKNIDNVLENLSFHLSNGEVPTHQLIRTLLRKAYPN